MTCLLSATGLLADLLLADLRFSHYPFIIVHQRLTNKPLVSLPHIATYSVLPTTHFHT